MDFQVSMKAGRKKTKYNWQTFHDVSLHFFIRLTRGGSGEDDVAVLGREHVGPVAAAEDGGHGDDGGDVDWGDETEQSKVVVKDKKGLFVYESALATAAEVDKRTKRSLERESSPG